MLRDVVQQGPFNFTNLTWFDDILRYICWCHYSYINIIYELISVIWLHFDIL